jgi:hypothetical protein
MASVGGGLPTGTVTFLFTDLESSTRLWEEVPDAMRVALAGHDPPNEFATRCAGASPRYSINAARSSSSSRRKPGCGESTLPVCPRRS